MAGAEMAGADMAGAGTERAERGESRDAAARLEDLGGIDEDSYVPAYIQLGRILQEAVRRGALRPGQRIPSESELGRLFGLSRMTVRRALSLLVEGGLLESRRGSGTFVVNPRTDGGLFFVPDFHEEMRSRGGASQVRLLGVRLVPARGTAAEKLGVKRGRRLLYLERLLEGEGEPCVFERKYMLYDKTQPLLEGELGHGPVGELYAGHPRFAPVRSELELQATLLREREAALLDGRPGDPAFCLEQLIFAANDLRVIWGWMILRGDRFSFRSLQAEPGR